MATTLITPVLTMREESSQLRWAKAAGLIVAGVLAAWSWLFVVSNWGPATRIDILTFKAGLSSKVMRTLLQPAYGSDHHDHASASVSGIYATPEYYAITEQIREASKYLPERFMVFYLFEDIHAGELPTSAPTLMLRVDNGRQAKPLDSATVRSSFHHRATVVRFPNTDADGTPMLEKASSFTLVAHERSTHSEQVMQWNLPIVYPNDLEDDSGISLSTLLALLAGLLAVLSPCLLQLTIYYTFALAGVSVQQSETGIAVARGRVVRTALYFMAGFTIVFTAAGALAGVVGEKLQTSGILEQWNRSLAVAAGAGIVILGVWVGVNSGAPGLCRLPVGATLRARGGWLEPLKMMFMGSAFAVGCSTCFGGALFISLMIYVGTVGSPSVGALALFLFSVGIAIPYMLSAICLSRALPLLSSFRRAASGIGLVCSVVLIFFGVILITDNFHVPSNLLYRLYLGL